MRYKVQVCLLLWRPKAKSVARGIIEGVKISWLHGLHHNSIVVMEIYLESCLQSVFLSQ